MRKALAGAERAGWLATLRTSNGGLDANWTTRNGIPTITFGAGQNNVHTVDEYVELKDFAEGCRLALALAHAHGAVRITAIAVFAASVSAMFGASALYHRGNWAAVWHRRLQRLDHAIDRGAHVHQVRLSFDSARRCQSDGRRMRGVLRYPGAVVDIALRQPNRSRAMGRRPIVGKHGIYGHHRHQQTEEQHG